MNKTKLKTYLEKFLLVYEIYDVEAGHKPVSPMGLDERSTTMRAWAIWQTFNAHHEAILSLQKEVDALSSQLKALQNPLDSEVELKKLLKTKK